MWHLWQSRLIISLVLPQGVRARGVLPTSICGGFEKEYSPREYAPGEYSTPLFTATSKKSTPPGSTRWGSTPLGETAFGSQELMSPGCYAPRSFSAQGAGVSREILSQETYVPQRRALPGVLSLERNTPCRRLLGERVSKKPRLYTKSVLRQVFPDE